MDTSVQEPVTTNLRWYVLQARPNTEKTVAKTLRERIAGSGLAAHFGEVLVPAEEVTDLKNGQKRKTEVRFFPGYVLVQVSTTASGIDSDCWHLIKETTGVAKFIGGTVDRPRPISDKEADTILQRIQRSVKAPRSKVLFERGQMVRVTEGPFVDFNGVVDEIDPAKGTVRVSVLIFGRATPVDFTVNQVAAA